MALQTINLGSSANDGTGDDLRTAFEKVISNFEYLESLFGEPIDAANIGPYTEQGIFKNKVNNVLNFKTIGAGNNIEIQTTDDAVLIGTAEDLDLNFHDINNVGRITVYGEITLDFGVELVGNTRGTHDGNLVGGAVYTTPLNPIGLIGDIQGRNPNLSPINPDYSPARVDGVAVRDLKNELTAFDFGSVTRTYKNPLQLVLDQIGVDLGGIPGTNPSLPISPIEINDTNGLRFV
jgi:hypothetical protein